MRFNTIQKHHLRERERIEKWNIEITRIGRWYGSTVYVNGIKWSPRRENTCSQ